MRGVRGRLPALIAGPVEPRRPVCKALRLTSRNWRWGQSSANSSLLRLFPVLRENTGKFVEFRLGTTIDFCLRSVNSIAYKPNSLSIGSGKCSPETGSATQLARERLLQFQAAQLSVN